MTDIIRPGSPSGNRLMHETSLQPRPGMLLSNGYFWRGRITHHDLTSAATSQALTLRTLFASGRTQGERIEAANPLPEDIIAGMMGHRLVTPFSGGGATTATVIIGRSGDTDAYTTSTSVFTGASQDWSFTVAAAEWPLRPFPNTDFDPIVTIASDVNVDLMTAGVMDVFAYILHLPVQRTS